MLWEGKTMVVRGVTAAALVVLLAACAQPAPEQSQPAAQPPAQAPAEQASPAPESAQPPAGETAQPSALQPPAAERSGAAAPAAPRAIHCGDGSSQTGAGAGERTGAYGNVAHRGR